MAKEKALTALPAPKNEQTKALTVADQVEKELTELSEANFYLVPTKGGQRREPDARALQYYANNHGGFCSKILDSGMDEKKAWALLQMWPQDKPNMVKEDKVTIVYEVEFQNLVWDRVDKGCERHKSGCPLLKDALNQLVFQNHTPVLADPVCQLKLRQQLNRKMKFAERECVTKAEARLHKKFLSFEWRDEEEIQNEQAEVAAVAATKQALPEASTTAPAPNVKTAPAAAAPPPEKKEAPKAPETTSQPFDLPKAHIPSEEEMRNRAVGQPAAPVTKPAEAPKVNGSDNPAGINQVSRPPKKRSERMNELCEQIGCSGTNMLAFIARSLGLSEPAEIKAKAKSEEIDAVIAGLEYCVKEFGPKIIGPFLRQEMPAGHQHETIAKAFLSMYSQEIKKSEGK